MGKKWNKKFFKSSTNFNELNEPDLMMKLSYSASDLMRCLFRWCFARFNLFVCLNWWLPESLPLIWCSSIKKACEVGLVMEASVLPSSIKGKTRKTCLKRNCNEKQHTGFCCYGIKLKEENEIDMPIFGNMSVAIKDKFLNLIYGDISNCELKNIILDRNWIITKHIKVK